MEKTEPSIHKDIHSSNIKQDNIVNDEDYPLIPNNDSTEGKPCGCSGNSVREINTIYSYVYALGKLDFNFPNRSIEMEYKHVVEIMNKSIDKKTNGLSDIEITHKIFNDPDYLYIPYNICWFLRIEGIETFILVPRHPGLIDRLTKSYGDNPTLDDIDLIIGIRGNLSNPVLCNGLILPIVYVDQIYSFDRTSLIESIPKSENINEDHFRKSSQDLFKHVIQIADNSGEIDEHRALNYLSVRYDAIYHKAYQMQENNYSLSSIDVRPSRLSGIRKIVDVIFSYQHRINGINEKYFTRVDVTEKFPFRVSPLQEYFDR